MLEGGGGVTGRLYAPNDTASSAVRNFVPLSVASTLCDLEWMSTSADIIHVQYSTT